jgi:hypothetical protein
VACARSARGLAVHAFPQRDRRKLLVSRLFLVQVGIEKADDIVMAEALGPCDQRAVARDFVVLDRLGGADDRGVEDFFVRDLARDFIGLADQTVDGGAFDSLRILTELLEYLLQARDLIFRLLEMVLQPFGQVAVRCLFDQLGERLSRSCFQRNRCPSARGAAGHPLSGYPW